MIAWLTDTLIYTGALIALVLVIRRPVARHFGPQQAYALWALPLLRFVMPPVVLPAEFAPQTAGGELLVVSVPVEAAVSAVPGAVPPALLSADAGAGLGEIVLALWLAGAAMFLVWRTWTYLRMREELLVGARPVGEVGKIRLVEAPRVGAPVAFGVSDKVVALPVAFMAMEDRAARDLAIEHELAHHRAWDLLANILAQPILALHWFNPLAWLGWRAMRRDQEAACDARVMVHRSAGERATYGEVIVGFAAGPRLALAAPMACPVLGEKSIIHRLRSLAMSEISPRRRIMGRFLLAGAALALPLTASISYAEASEEALAPIAPEAPVSPVPPVAPVTPVPAIPAVPAVPAIEPVPPVPPVAPEPPPVTVQVVIDKDGAAPRGAASTQTRKARKFVFKGEPADVAALKEKMHVLRSQDAESASDAADEGDPAFDFDFDLDFGDGPFAFAFASPAVAIDCGNGTKAQVAAGDEQAIRKQVVICQKQSMASAREAITKAREAVARDRELSERVREEVLRSLDRELKRLSSDG